MGGGFWSVLVIGGPILLIAVFVWGYLRNRNTSERTTERAERGAAELRDDIERGVPPPKS
jgi:hypothetical protein